MLSIAPRQESNRPVARQTSSKNKLVMVLMCLKPCASRVVFAMDNVNHHIYVRNSCLIPCHARQGHVSRAISVPLHLTRLAPCLSETMVNICARLIRWKVLGARCTAPDMAQVYAYYDSLDTDYCPEFCHTFLMLRKGSRNTSSFVGDDNNYRSLLTTQPECYMPGTSRTTIFFWCKHRHHGSRIMSCTTHRPSDVTRKTTHCVNARWPCLELPAISSKALRTYRVKTFKDGDLISTHAAAH